MAHNLASTAPRTCAPGTSTACSTRPGLELPPPAGAFDRWRGTRPVRSAREQVIETGWDAPILGTIVELVDGRARSLFDIAAAKA